MLSIVTNISVNWPRLIWPTLYTQYGLSDKLMQQAKWPNALWIFLRRLRCQKKRRMLDENQLTFMAAAAGRSVDDVIRDATDISAKVGFLSDCSASVLTARWRQPGRLRICHVCPFVSGVGIVVHVSRLRRRKPPCPGTGSNLDSEAGSRLRMLTNHPQFLTQLKLQHRSSCACRRCGCLRYWICRLPVFTVDVRESSHRTQLTTGSWFPHNRKRFM